jgi:hypothetical protein
MVGAIAIPCDKTEMKKILEEAYAMLFGGDVSSHIYLLGSLKYGIGGIIKSTVYHKVDKMKETYIKTDHDQNFVFAVVHQKL